MIQGCHAKRDLEMEKFEADANKDFGTCVDAALICMPIMKKLACQMQQASNSRMFETVGTIPVAQMVSKQHIEPYNFKSDLMDLLSNFFRASDEVVQEACDEYTTLIENVTNSSDQQKFELFVDKIIGDSNRPVFLSLGCLKVANTEKPHIQMAAVAWRCENQSVLPNDVRGHIKALLKMQLVARLTEKKYKDDTWSILSTFSKERDIENYLISLARNTVIELCRSNSAEIDEIKLLLREFRTWISAEESSPIKAILDGVQKKIAT
eukprot:GEMP01067962.1.p1 GENE.GEMP01067962.1~~GEMP01067962.1.p1  ORF type:complete len:266 (+),score=28.24 GEMP01067962.1:50-847(+)